MKITEFIAARLDEESPYVDTLRQSLTDEPPAGASYRLGAVRQHDTTRHLVDDLEGDIADGDELPAVQPALDIAKLTADRWADHPDFQPEWRWHGGKVRRDPAPHS